MPVRRTPKVEALVVNAIRRLQDVQGSTSREISNYISQEYNIPGKDIRPQLRLALQRGMSYGILQRSQGGYYSCNRDYVRQLSVGDEAGDGVMEPCPGGISPQRRAHWRRYWRKIRARRRRERERRALKKRREERKRREQSRRRRGRSRSRGRGRRGRGRRRRRGRPRRRSRRARSRRGRRRSRRRARRSRGRGGRSRSRAVVDSREMETATMATTQPTENVPTNEDSDRSATSVESEKSTEQQKSPQVLDASDDA